MFFLNNKVGPKVKTWYHQLLASDFFVKVIQTFATRIMLIGLATIMSVLVSRWLGPTNRGIYAIAVLIGALGMQFGNLGLHASNTYFVAQNRNLLPGLMGNSLVIGLGLGSFISCFIWFLLFLRPELSPISGNLLVLTLAVIPLGLIYLLLQNLLLGIHEVRTYNNIELITKISTLLLLFVTFLFNQVSVVMLLWITLATLLVALVLSMVKLLRYADVAPRISLPLFQDGFHYGYKSYLAALFSFLVIRADLFLVNYFLGQEQSGYYSIAITLTDMVYILPIVCGTILFPKLSSMNNMNDKWLYTKKVAIILFTLISGLAIFLFLISSWIIRLLFGQAFMPARIAFVWLLPAIVFLSVNTILMNFFGSIGNPKIIIFSPFVALVVNVMLNLVLIPGLGIVGASISSIVAYGLMLGFSIFFIVKNRRSYGIKP
jgi:O-antigen/teichoic acid export membrane protein